MNTTFGTSRKPSALPITPSEYKALPTCLIRAPSISTKPPKRTPWGGYRPAALHFESHCTTCRKCTAAAQEAEWFVRDLMGAARQLVAETRDKLRLRCHASLTRITTLPTGNFPRADEIHGEYGQVAYVALRLNGTGVGSAHSPSGIKIASYETWNPSTRSEYLSCARIAIRTSDARRGSR
jgi:hypothetical protein